MITSIFISFLTVSIIVSVIIALMLLLSSFRKQHIFAKWSCLIWFVLALRLLVPVHYSIPQAPIQITLPQTRITTAVKLSAANVNQTPQNLSSTADSANAAADNETSVTLLQVLAFIWLMGVVIFLIHKLISYRIFKRSVYRWSRSATDSRLIIMVDELAFAMKIRADVAIYVSRKVKSPMMMGLTRPQLFLPDAEYTDTELTYILSHELVHWKRHDIWYKLILLIANAVHWFNPFVYLMNLEASKDIELSCDDIVMKGASPQERREYSEALLSTIHKQQPGAAVLTTYFYGGSKQMKERFKNIFHTGKRRRVIFALFIIVILGIAGVLAAFQVKEKKPELQLLVTLRDLTNKEYSDVGTSKIVNPTIYDFKKLIFKLNLKNTKNRKITFPTLNKLSTLFSNDEYWVGGSSIQDNQYEDYAHYDNEIVLYTRNLSNADIKSRLKSIKIGAVYTDEHGNKVKKIYRASDILVIIVHKHRAETTKPAVATQQPTVSVQPTITVQPESTLTPAAVSEENAASLDDAKPGIIKQIGADINSNISITNAWKSDKILEDEFDYYLVLAGSSKNDAKQGEAIVYQHMKNSKLKLTQTYLTPSKHGAITITNHNGYNLSVKASDGHQWILNLWNGFSENP